MLALLFFAFDAEPQNKTPVLTPAPIVKVESKAANDWSVAIPQVKTPEQKNEFDPTQPLYSQSSMCVIIKGQPEPDCAKTNSQQALVLNDDLFGINIGGDESTCQSVETVKKDANGNPKRVFTTFCGEDPARSDFKERLTPSGGDFATKPSNRKIGPNEVVSLNTQ